MRLKQMNKFAHAHRQHNIITVGFNAQKPLHPPASASWYHSACALFSSVDPQSSFFFCRHFIGSCVARAARAVDTCCE
jgi:hypothetical protein